MKNGKGFYKEYCYSSNLKIEGESINGYLNGKCTEYYTNNNDEIISFEGEYLNGKKWNGKGYNTDTNIIYELINGKGKVKYYDVDSYDSYLEFDCEYINGEKNGNCKDYYYNGNLKFESEYKDGKKMEKGNITMILMAN